MKRLFAGIALVLACLIASASAANAQTVASFQGEITSTEYNYEIGIGGIKKIVEATVNAYGPKVCTAWTDASSVKIVGYVYATPNPDRYVWIRYRNADGWNRVAKKWWRATRPSDLCI